MASANLTHAVLDQEATSSWLPLGINGISLILLLIGTYLLKVLATPISDPLRKVPGPLAARFSRLWYANQMFAGHWSKTETDLHKRHGKVVRTAPNHYVIQDADAPKTMYGHGTKFLKGDWYGAWGTPSTHETNLFSLQDPHKHAALRRNVASIYSMSTLVQYEPFVNECIELFTKRLEEFAADGKAFDIAHWVQCYAFDVIGTITFSTRFGFLDRGEDIEGIINTLEAATTYGTIIGEFLPVHRFLSQIVAKVVDFNPIAVVEGYAWRSLAAYKTSTEEKNNMIAKMYSSRKSDEDPAALESSVIATALGNIAAGSDTTSIALTSVFFHLMRCPEAVVKLRIEIDEAAAAGTVSDPITFNQAQKLSYLQAVIKEGLRIFPSVALPMWRVVPEGGATIAGVFFPPGANVGINPWFAHREPSVFGPDADAFRPERWLESSKEQLTAMENNFLAFGMGSRTCIGKNISLLEMSKLVPQLVRKFDFHTEETEIRARNNWFHKPIGLDATVKRRSVDSS